MLYVGHRYKWHAYPYVLGYGMEYMSELIMPASPASSG